MDTVCVDSLHLPHLILFILQDKISKLKQDINGRHMTIVFDCMTRVRGLCDFFVVCWWWLGYQAACLLADVSSQISHRGRMCLPVNNCSINWVVDTAV